MFLECSDILKTFGGLVALKGVNLTVNQGEIVGLIGANGAGKTTLFNVISGFLRNSFSGLVKFQGVELNPLRPHKVCRLGIARTFQVVRPLHEFTVHKNVEIGVIFGNIAVENSTQTREKTLEILRFAGLEEKGNYRARELTLADLKRLEVARAVATSPKLLLLDEMLSGLNASETTEAIKFIYRIRNEMGITIFLIEHVMKAVMEICERIVVLDYGEKIAEGTPTEIGSNREVIKAYLGNSRWGSGEHDRTH
jgi:branched-chain amino acid transport system ATP-binding protein